MKKLCFSLLTVLMLAAYLPQTAAAEEERTSDTWLQAQLVTLYTVNRHLSVFDIDTTVKDGVAYLQGVVDSDVERSLAVEIARSVEGVKEVKNNLEVASKEKDKRLKGMETAANSFAQKVEDMTTTAAVKSNLLMNSSVNGMDIDVTTSQGTVTLSGSVASDEARSLVEKIADNTSGVEKVNNDLTLSKKS